MSEVEVVADVAIDRKTPVAFSTIPAKKIEEELAGQDIPMLLNLLQVFTPHSKVEETVMQGLIFVV